MTGFVGERRVERGMVVISTARSVLVDGATRKAESITRDAERRVERTCRSRRDSCQTHGIVVSVGEDHPPIADVLLLTDLISGQNHVLQMFQALKQMIDLWQCGDQVRIVAEVQLAQVTGCAERLVGQLLQAIAGEIEFRQRRLADEHVRLNLFNVIPFVIEFSDCLR